MNHNIALPEPFPIPIWRRRLMAFFILASFPIWFGLLVLCIVPYEILKNSPTLFVICGALGSLACFVAWGASANWFFRITKVPPMPVAEQKIRLEISRRRQKDFGEFYIDVGGLFGGFAAVASFFGTWIYCAFNYGFLFGFGFGWLPAAILAALVFAVARFGWPLALAFGAWVVWLIATGG